MSSHGNGTGTVAGRGTSEWIRGLRTAGSGESHIDGQETGPGGHCEAQHWQVRQGTAAKGA